MIQLLTLVIMWHTLKFTAQPIKHTQRLGKFQTTRAEPVLKLLHLTAEL